MSSSTTARRTRTNLLISATPPHPGLMREVCRQPASLGDDDNNVVVLVQPLDRRWSTCRSRRWPTRPPAPGPAPCSCTSDRRRRARSRDSGEARRIARQRRRRRRRDESGPDRPCASTWRPVIDAVRELSDGASDDEGIPRSPVLFSLAGPTHHTDYRPWPITTHQPKTYAEEHDPSGKGLPPPHRDRRRGGAHQVTPKGPAGPAVGAGAHGVRRTPHRQEAAPSRTSRSAPLPHPVNDRGQPFCGWAYCIIERTRCTR